MRSYGIIWWVIRKGWPQFTFEFRNTYTQLLPYIYLTIIIFSSYLSELTINIHPNVMSSDSSHSPPYIHPSTASVTTGGDGENSGLQPFPATAQKIGSKSPPLDSARCPPLQAPEMWESLGGCPHWARSGSRPSLQNYRHGSVGHRISQASVVIAVWCLCAFPVMLFHLSTEQNRKCHRSWSGSQWGWKSTSVTEILTISIVLCVHHLFGLCVTTHGRAVNWHVFVSCFPCCIVPFLWLIMVCSFVQSTRLVLLTWSIVTLF